MPANLGFQVPVQGAAGEASALQQVADELGSGGACCRLCLYMLRPGILAGFAGDRTLAVLIGNTKHIWRPFLEACSWDPSLLEAENPLEAYVERTVTAIVDSALQGCVLPVTPLSPVF